MLPKVAISPHCCAEGTNLDNYAPLLEPELLDELHQLAAALKGLRVLHLNATSGGGGVAELLWRLIPLYRALGLQADWSTIHGDQEFFRITKGLHNALQGARLPLPTEARSLYVSQNQATARELDLEYDVVVVHDPQPAAVRSSAPAGKSKWIWRCHIDSSSPDPEVWDFLRPFVDGYDAVVFTMEAFRPGGLQRPKLAYIAPAIDAFAAKNMEMPREFYRRVVADAGVDLRRPLIVQVSRFDPWKDPLGVIEMFHAVKKARGDVQLAMVGAMAGDDPEGWELLRAVNRKAADERDLYVFTNQTGVGSLEVNAFQRAADVVIQKSLKEGFGLVISETFWKERPIVAGATGGIPMQFPPGHERFLVRTIEECAAQVLFLLGDGLAAAEFGRAGRGHVQKHFLMPRLLRDELRLMRDLLA